jgi:mannose/fructose-specific phosphotransferase system component IIA
MSAMRHFLTASHGPLAGAILKSAAFIGDVIAGVSVIEVMMEDSGDTIRERVESVFSAYGEEDEIIAMTDVFGGNVTNILTEYIGRRRLHLITGMNLAMILEALLSDPSMDTETLVDRLCRSGREGVKHVNYLMEEKGEEEEI